MSNTTQPTCSICGKPLSDPLSIMRGIGPDCWLSQITKRRQDKSGNLFANRAQYTWGIDGQILWIKDADSQGRSLTNDLENCLAEIQAQIDTPLDAYKIIYKDSDGIWDGIRLTAFKLSSVLIDAQWLSDRRYPHYFAKGLDIDFYFIGEKSYEAAKKKVMSD